METGLRTREDEVDRLFDEARAARAGRRLRRGRGRLAEEDVPVWRLPLERWEATPRANLTASFLTARAFLREVERSGQPRPRRPAESAILHGLLLSLRNEIVRVR